MEARAWSFLSCLSCTPLRAFQQAARVSDHTAFFYIGELIESGLTPKIFTNPSQKRTEDYVTGRFG